MGWVFLVIVLLSFILGYYITVNARRLSKYSYEVRHKIDKAGQEWTIIRIRFSGIFFMVASVFWFLYTWSQSYMPWQ